MQKTIPPDDVYIFAESAMIMAHFFLEQIVKNESYEKIKEDKIFKSYGKNVTEYFFCQRMNLDIEWKLKDEENNS